MVEENATTTSFENPLTPEERRKILTALNEKKKLANLYCTGCRYCMSCPKDGCIPRNFELVNYYPLYELEEYAKNQFGLKHTKNLVNVKRSVHRTSR
ncbi:MAG: hypothetical protein FK732_00940 [Asgard group archaeon]|nr:hypothetical protein [Asgard group archaeon]